MKILLIEDSRFLRLAIERILSKGGHEVIALGDGEEGLRAALATLPHLILLDMMLPGLDGTSVLKRLKLDPLTAQIPVVILTGLSQRNETKLKEAGAAAFIEKSSLNLKNNAQALVRAVDDVLRQSCLTTPLHNR